MCVEGGDMSMVLWEKPWPGGPDEEAQYFWKGA